MINIKISKSFVMEAFGDNNSDQDLPYINLPQNIVVMGKK